MRVDVPKPRLVHCCASENVLCVPGGPPNKNGLPQNFRRRALSLPLRFGHKLMGPGSLGAPRRNQLLKEVRALAAWRRGERKSGVEGKRVAVRVDRGGRRILKKNMKGKPR